MLSSEEERAATIRLIKAHAADCERRGARLLAAGYGALVSEIEDAMQHDLTHVESLERDRRPTPPDAWVKAGARFTTRDRGVYRGVVLEVWRHESPPIVTFEGEVSRQRHVDFPLAEFAATYRPLEATDG